MTFYDDQWPGAYANQYSSFNESVQKSIAQVIHLKIVISVVYYDGVDNFAVNNTFTIM